MNPLIVGPLVKFGAPLLKEAISAIIPGPTGEKLASKLLPEFLNKAADVDLEITERQASIIKAEMSSDSWMTRNWRPLCMLVMVGVVALNLIIVPICNTFLFPTIAFVINLLLPIESHVGILAFEVVDIDQNVWDLIKLAIPGYIGARTVDKGFKMWSATRSIQATEQTTRAVTPQRVEIPPDATKTTNVPARYSSITDIPIQGSE